MTERNDDSFPPKPAPLRAKRSVSPRFISRVIKAASQAGPVREGRVSSKRGREGGKLGRGFVQAPCAVTNECDVAIGYGQDADGGLGARRCPVDSAVIDGGRVNWERGRSR